MLQDGVVNDSTVARNVIARKKFKASVSVCFATFKSLHYLFLFLFSTQSSSLPLISVVVITLFLCVSCLFDFQEARHKKEREEFEKHSNRIVSQQRAEISELREELATTRAQLQQREEEYAKADEDRQVSLL